MDKSMKLLCSLDSLSVYDSSGNEVLAALREMLSCRGADTVSKTARFFSKISAQKSLGEAIADFVLQNDNAFSRAAAAGRESELPQALRFAARYDLDRLEELCEVTAQDIISCVEDRALRTFMGRMPQWDAGKKVFPFTAAGEKRLQALAAFHRKNGFGVFVKYKAFSFAGGRLQPIAATDGVRLGDLKNYDEERRRAVLNTQQFLNNLPANNVLFYGDRGTGKSATVHALLNEFAPAGLRMIEVPKAEISRLGALRALLGGNPMKFIVFIDDLTFSPQDAAFAELKAVLEGSLAAGAENMLIYATSNRRHLVNESFAERENEVNRNDVMQEQLSLSDRFGLTITFINPDKRGYLDIVGKIAADRGLAVDRERLFAAAERWAARKGGRSPRCAKQLVDYIESAEKSGTAW